MARRLPSLNALKAFEAAARHGRMTLAADELCVSHSAVSRQVQALEQALGIALFEGPKNRMRLTEAGQRLRTELTASFDKIDGAVAAVTMAEEGPLDVSCPGTFTMRWLIPRLYGFQALHPAVEVRLAASSRPVDFGRDGFDVAIRVGTPPWPAGPGLAPLFPERTGLVHAPGLAARLDGKGPNPPTLHARTRPRAWQDWVDRTGTVVAAGPRKEFEHFYFMIEAASAGLGMCVAPWHYVRDEVRAGRLVAPHGFSESGQAYVALRRQGPDRKSRRFCEWIRDEAVAFESGDEIVDGE